MLSDGPLGGRFCHRQDCNFASRKTDVFPRIFTQFGDRELPSTSGLGHCYSMGYMR